VQLGLCRAVGSRHGAHRVSGVRAGRGHDDNDRCRGLDDSCGVVLPAGLTAVPDRSAEVRSDGDYTREVVFIYRVSDGKVAERWAIRDDLGFLRQLGVSLR
jgi:hypothetical protein